jgi:hypothetical protein
MSSATRRNSLALFGATLALALSLALAGVASAAPIGKDGKLHACYRVKGKPKGALRVVRSVKARCHRGERKVSWALAGAVGAAGAPGASGTTGTDGSAGAAGAAGADSVLSRTELEERITTLTDRVEALEALTARVDSLEGVVQGVCDEVTAVIAQTNLLRGSVGTLVSTLSGSLLGPIFGSVGLPPALPETLTCPA